MVRGAPGGCFNGETSLQVGREEGRKVGSSSLRRTGFLPSSLHLLLPGPSAPPPPQLGPRRRLAPAAAATLPPRLRALLRRILAAGLFPPGFGPRLLALGFLAPGLLPPGFVLLRLLAS